MSWDHEPPTTPPQSGGGSSDQAEGNAAPPPPFAPPGDRPTEPTPEVAPTVETPSPFRPAPTAEVPPPPPPVPPAPGPYAPPAAPTSDGAPVSPWGAAPPSPGAVPPGGGVTPPGASSWGGPPTPPPLPLAGASEPRRPNRFLRAMVGLVVVVGLFGIGFGVRSIVDDDPDRVVQGASTVASIPEVTIDPGSEPVAAVAQVISPSVVQIETTGGLGSGVVYDSSGLVMTNAHVVGNATKVTVRTADGTAVDGDVLGADTGTDIAVVRAPGLDVPPAALALDTVPAVGQIAVAVGSPYGLDQTVTSGIVSAVNRPVDNDKGVVVSMIQTDASINPGNSGGALANRDGLIIGINTAIFSQTGENTGIGFAIPITTAKKAADQLVNGQSVAKAGLGLTGPSETPNGDAGAYVESVTPGSAAADAGIQNGDLIVEVDGTDIRSFDELRGLVSSRSPGETVTVTVVRDGERQDLEVTLGTLGTGEPTEGD
jgi:putative serine protease PepD